MIKMPAEQKKWSAGETAYFLELLSPFCQNNADFASPTHPEGGRLA
jgi:hypothetical protein